MAMKTHIISGLFIVSCHVASLLGLWTVSPVILFLRVYV